MSPSESIVFNPTIPERELDREASKVDKRLAESGQIQPEIGDVQGELDLGGVGGVGGFGGGGRDGGFGSASGAGTAAGLASRIPKPIAGVTAGAALPIALTGAVGVGLLGAMQNASARMQTSANLLGQAWNNTFRPLGDKLDQLFIRDLVTDLVDETQKFEETLRSGDWAAGFTGLFTGIFPDEATLGNTIASSIGFVLGGPAGARVVTGLVNDIDTAITNAVSGFSWPDIGGMWPGWPSINTDWPGWPSIDTEWPGWPSIDTQWPGWPDALDSFSWPNISSDPWPSSGQLLGKFPNLSPGSLRDAILGNDDNSSSNNNTSNNGSTSNTADSPLDRQQGDPTKTPSGSGYVPPWATGASGGRVQNTGLARIHKDEIIAPEDRLVEELSRAISAQSGGGGGAAEVDTSDVEAKLDRLNRNITQLAQAMQSMSIDVEQETLGRLAAKGQREDVTDTDPLVR